MLLMPMQATQGIKNEADAQHTLLDGMVRVRTPVGCSSMTFSLGWFSSGMHEVCCITFVVIAHTLSPVDCRLLG